jgi:hypothetical protein
LAQQDGEPADEAAEVVAGGGEDGLGGVAATESKIIASHAVLGFEMAVDGFDGRPAAQLTLDNGRQPELLAGDEDPELVIGRRLWPRYPLSARRRAMMLPMSACPNHGGQRVTVIGIAGHRHHMGDELAALGVADRGHTVNLAETLLQQPPIQRHQGMLRVDDLVGPGPEEVLLSYLARLRGCI